MTITEVFDKNQINYKRVKAEKNMILYKIGEMNVMVWINDGNSFKMKKSWFEILEGDCNQYSLFLCDKKNKQYYYIKFPNKNNWLSGSFKNCDKEELFLGKQVLNYSSTITKLLIDLKRYSM